MALQGDLLAAHVLGIQNVMVVRGEDMVNADHHEAKAVDDLDELGLLGAIKSLQRGAPTRMAAASADPMRTKAIAAGEKSVTTGEGGSHKEARHADDKG